MAPRLIHISVVWHIRDVISSMADKPRGVMKQDTDGTMVTLGRWNMNMQIMFRSYSLEKDKYCRLNVIFLSIIHKGE